MSLTDYQSQEGLQTLLPLYLGIRVSKENTGDGARLYLYGEQTSVSIVDISNSSSAGSPH